MEVLEKLKNDLFSGLRAKIGDKKFHGKNKGGFFYDTTSYRTPEEWWFVWCEINGRDYGFASSITREQFKSLGLTVSDVESKLGEEFFKEFCY